jgi:hypothetical protein
MHNLWLETNGRRVEEIKNSLIELGYKGSYNEVPLLEIYRLLKGSVNEILRLQAEYNRLNSELEKMKKQLKG